MFNQGAGQSQRERIVGAMAALGGRDGYAAVSVEQVIQLAGVSRATFYRHFRNRDQCFRAAYRRAVAPVWRWLEEVPPASGGDALREALEASLRAAATDSARARLILERAFGASPATRAEHERLLVAVERWITALPAADPASFVGLSPLALLGAAAGVIGARLRHGETETLPGLLNPLLEWVALFSTGDAESPGFPEPLVELGHRLAASRASREQGDGPRLLPRGRGALSSAEVVAERRARALAATARMTASKGYAALTVEDIASAARIGRRAFYTCFRDKQDAYLAAQAEALQGAMATAAAAFAARTSWPDRVWNAGEGMLSFVASHPDLAYLGLVEVHAAGEAAIRRSEDSRNAFGLFLEPAYIEYGWPHRVGRSICTEAIAGAVYALMRRQVLRGRTHMMLSLLPQFVHIVLTPFLGPHAAASFVAARVQAASAAP